MNLFHRGIFIAGVVLSFTCCTEEKNPVQQYGNGLVQSYKNTQKLESSINVQQVQRSIQEFYAANGRYPADLDEVASSSGVVLKSDNYAYDPSTGALTAKQ